MRTIGRIGAVLVWTICCFGQEDVPVYVGTETGLYSSLDGGRSWVAAAALNGLRVSAVEIDPSNPARLFAAAGDGIFVSSDAGTTWQLLPGSPVAVRQILVDPAEPNRIYAAGTRVHFSRDGGLQWTTPSASPADTGTIDLAIDPREPLVMYAGSTAGTYVSTDAGETWRRLPAATRIAYISVGSEGEVYGSDGGTFFLSRDKGARWQELDPDEDSLGRAVGFNWTGDLGVFEPRWQIRRVAADPIHAQAFGALVKGCLSLSMGDLCSTGLLRHDGGSWTPAPLRSASGPEGWLSEDIRPALAFDGAGNAYASTGPTLHRLSSASTSWQNLRTFAGDILSIATVPLHARVSTVRNAAAPEREGPVAPDSIVSVFGANLAASITQASTLPLPGRLADTQVLINGGLAGLYFVSPAQVNVYVPANIRPGVATLEVLRSGKRSAARRVDIAGTAPALFTRGGRGAILHGATFAPVTPEEPASRGEIVSLFGTGLGVGGAAAVMFDGLAALPEYIGPAPGLLGVFQVNVRVPAGVRTGTVAVGVVVDTVASNTVGLDVR